jgi:hypothetical protein
MEYTEERREVIGESAGRQPRFGSYIGVFFILAMIGILCFELLKDPGVAHAYNALKPGMTTTQVAAVLGVPRSETKSGSQTVQTWQIPDGHTIVIEFQDGKLTAKERKAQGEQRP